MSRRRQRVRALLACLVLLPAVPLTTPLQAAETVPEPGEYRLDHYRAPTPATLAGASVIDAVTLHQRMASEAITVIDVLPQPPRPDKLPADTLWRPAVRNDIPGSVWLANTGYGQLAPEMERFFATALERLSLGDRNRPLAFYCEAECWMSWNAARRAVALGYRHVLWFAGGVDAWTAAGYPTLANQPLDMRDLH